MTPEYILRKSLCRPAHCWSAHVPGEGYVNDGSGTTARHSVDDYNQQRRRAAETEIECMNWSPDYAEPGYDTPKRGILFANWNIFPRDIGDTLERAGYAIEWSDEWTTCDQCRKAVRTSANSYGWTRSYTEDENSGDVLCESCTLEDPIAYLESLEGNDRKAVTLKIDPADHGYVKIDADYENGFHPGQNDSPEVIGKSLRAVGVSRYLFVITDVGQFDVRFAVYVHEDEQGNVPPTIDSSLPYDIATELSNVLQGKHSDYYTVKTKQISRDELISGSWTKE